MTHLHLRLILCSFVVSKLFGLRIGLLYGCSLFRVFRAPLCTLLGFYGSGLSGLRFGCPELVLGFRSRLKVAGSSLGCIRGFLRARRELVFSSRGLWGWSMRCQESLKV